MADLGNSGVRKIVSFIEDTHIEGGRVAAPPLRLIGVAAVVINPWAGRGFTEDLQPGIQKLAPLLGDVLSQEIVKHAGGGARVEAYGKAAVVGTDGEVEHAAGLIHTLKFGNRYRKAVGAKNYLSFTNIRGGPGTSFAIPMVDKHEPGKRSHYLTLQFSIADAPAPNEIVVALGASIGGRPHHRIGDRFQDLKELGGTDVV